MTLDLHVHSVQCSFSISTQVEIERCHDGLSPTEASPNVFPWIMRPLDNMPFYEVTLPEV
jgi:hypothetical protein